MLIKSILALTRNRLIANHSKFSTNYKVYSKTFTNNNKFLRNNPCWPTLNAYQLNSVANITIIRHKYSKKSSNQDLDSDSDDEDEKDFVEERGSKIIKTTVSSLRADLILKSGLNIARNKIETIFYDSKIRVNGKKIPKKSVQLHVGDEVDVIKGFSTINPEHLIVSRVQILSAKDKDDEEGGIVVHLRRYKSLLVENYEGQDAFKASQSSNE